MKSGLVAIVGLVVCGCGEVSEDQPDAAGVDASSDATSARCDLTKPFGPAVPVAGVNTNSSESWGWLSSDQMTIYFQRNPASGTDTKVYFATRSQQSGPFTNVALIGGVDTTGPEGRPVLTNDGLTLFMEVFGTGGTDIHIATRASVAATFSAPAPVAAINTTSTDHQPWISDDGLLMYFTSNRAGTYDIFKTSRTSTSSQFSAPMLVGELSSPTLGEYTPVASKDGLEIFFAATPDPNTPNVCCDIFHARRSTPSDGFGTPTIVSELSSTSDEFPNWVSPDRCQLVFSSNRGGGSGDYDIWMATRSQ